jgi:hypothetical protein
LIPFVAATIVARRTLPYARVLARSFREHHPDLPFVTLLADELDRPDGADPLGADTADRLARDLGRDGCELVPLAAVPLAGRQQLLFRYGQQELSFALTPHLLSLLLDRGHRRVVFLKQESLVLGDLRPALAELGAPGGASALLTPHLLAPLTGPDAPRRELDVLLAGVYNGGFVAVAEAPPARAFLRWWAERTARHCRHAVGDGMHYEQRWLDLAPVFFAGVRLLRDPGVNVGHWNLPERQVEVDRDGAVRVDGLPARLVRFSGFDPAHPEAATRYSPRLRTRSLGPAAALFERFRGELVAQGYHQALRAPYGYDRFDNGVAIPELARRLYGDHDAPERFGDPFAAAGPDSFYAWLRSAAGERGDPGRRTAGGASALPRLWLAVHRLRSDLQRAFPDPEGADREAFLRWTASSGLREHGIDPAFLPGLVGAAAAPGGGRRR